MTLAKHNLDQFINGLSNISGNETALIDQATRAITNHAHASNGNERYHAENHLRYLELLATLSIAHSLNRLCQNVFTPEE
jgi:hypothetical protein